MKKLSLLFLIGFLCFSCNKSNTLESTVQDSEISKTSVGESGYIPYADSASLAEFQTDTKVVGYQLARKLAIMELQSSGLKTEMKWTGCEISKRPVVIYGFDSKPKFYEFIVKDAEKKEIGTVSVHARRTKGGVLNEINGSVKNYSSLLSKGANMKLFATYGGSLYLGVPSKAGDAPTLVVNPQTGLAVTGLTELSDDQILKVCTDSLKSSDATAQATTDTISDPIVKNIFKASDSIPVETRIQNLKAAMDLEHKERDEFWNLVSQNADSLLSVSDSVLNEQTTKSFWSKLMGNYTDNIDLIQKYVKKVPFHNYGFTQENPMQWCGAWAANWIYYVNCGGDNYDYFLSFTAKIGKGRPMLPGSFFFALSGISGWQITAGRGLSFGTADAYNSVRRYHQPVIIYVDWDHWIVAYGTRGDGNRFWHNYYFAYNDNGYLNKNVFYQNSEAIGLSWRAGAWFMAYVQVYAPY